MDRLPEGFLEAMLDGLRREGWVLIPPDKVKEMRSLLGVVLDTYLDVPHVPTDPKDQR